MEPALTRGRWQQQAKPGQRRMPFLDIAGHRQADG
jgi:hypothetical protein